MKKKRLKELLGVSTENKKLKFKPWEKYHQEQLNPKSLWIHLGFLGNNLFLTTMTIIISAVVLWYCSKQIYSCEDILTQSDTLKEVLSGVVIIKKQVKLYWILFIPFISLLIINIISIRFHNHYFKKYNCD